MTGKRHRVPFCSCDDLRELARTSASAIAIIDLHKRWPPFPIAGTGARALLRALASVARMRGLPAVAQRAKPEATSGTWCESPAYRGACHRRASAIALVAGARPVGSCGYLLFYRRRRGLDFGGSVPVIARYHAASDCASALSAARSDCARWYWLRAR
jgi:hypothetical protein